MTGRREAMVLWFVAGVLCVEVAATVAVGVVNARTAAGLSDLRQRGAEYAVFREGVYPNRRIADVPAERRLPYTVYPPYALPMFAVFFEPGGITQAAILVAALSLGALVAIGVQGWRWLAPVGRSWGALAAVCGAAVAGNATVYQLGQFSIISTGLIVLQIACLERGRPVAAGVCWALAMLKPQIGMPFAIMFFPGRSWRGLVAGLAILAGLTFFACWWTDVTLWRMARHWLFGMPMFFAAHAQGLGPGPLAVWLGLDPRIVIGVGLGVLVASMAIVLWLMGRSRERIDPISLAGVAAVLGELCLYHYHYDNIMLMPTLFGLLRIVAARPTPAAAIITVLMMGTVFLPHRVIVEIPANGWLRGAIWAAAAATLLADGFARSRLRRSGEPARAISGLSGAGVSDAVASV